MRARRAAAALVLAAAAAAAVLAGSKEPLRGSVPLSQAVYDRGGRLLRLTLASDDRYRLWTPLSSISPLVVEATLLQEDREFRRHFGVNPYALGRAFRKTYLRARGPRIGGSTITMQLARIRWGLDSRSPRGKAEQILRALQLELRYSKDEILEAYLNLVPYGGNIHGVGAASLVYFGKRPSELTLPEALALCVIPKSPARRSPGAAEGAEWLKARRELFDRWARLHPADEAQRSLLELPPNAKTAADLPFHAPHFTQSVLRERPVDGTLRTTLDLPVQRLMERRLREYVDSRRQVGIRNAAAMLVDARTMEVRAAVGSADFKNAQIQGQVDGTRARRSPGSALKPFVYALGMDQGLIHPMSLLKDAPTSFGAFNPENFDREFLGPVHARDALIKSRNVPAVHVASKLKAPNLYEFLKSAGVGPLKEEAHYGLALALGAAEVTMEELVQLYAMLANQGMMRPLRTTSAAPDGPGARLLSAEAAFLVMDILKDNPRPAQGFRQAWTRDPLSVHWKTGTSFAFRDAWSVGVFGPYVVAVWVGNFDGEGNPAFVGVDAAAPLMFRVVDAVRAHEPGLAAPARPWPFVARERVCAVSGQMPGPRCPRHAQTWFIPGKSPIKVCELHRGVWVDGLSGRRLCSPKAAARQATYEHWPSDLQALFRQAGLARAAPPGGGDDCPLSESSTRGLPPAIVSPRPGVEYPVRSAAPGKIPLSATADADARRLYWFVDDRFVGATGVDQPLYWDPVPGRRVVRAIDDRGRSDAREISVSVVQ
ncbi:MAG: penicillin-binding protein 1C [Elusimicrobia bacterium]|nr:penicillin-binding protein 1C [Elusimicrobiota bacterium]